MYVIAFFSSGPVGGGGNKAPIADAGSDQTPNISTLVTLDGSASSDPDGDDLTFSWVETTSTGVSITNANTDSPTFTTLGTPETYTFELTVSDPKGKFDTDTVTITVT